jgi:hypothetical protein
MPESARCCRSALWSAYSQGALSPRAEYSAYAGRVSCSLTSANGIVSTPTGLRPAPPLSAQPQNAVVLRCSGVKTSPPPHPAAQTGGCSCGTPPGGVRKCRRVWRVWQKALQVCGGNGGAGLQRGHGAASSARRDMHCHGYRYLTVVRMTERMPLVTPLLGSGGVWLERVSQVRSAHTATATATGWP